MSQSHMRRADKSIIRTADDQIVENTSTDVDGAKAEYSRLGNLVQPQIQSKSPAPEPERGAEAMDSADTTVMSDMSVLTEYRADTTSMNARPSIVASQGVHSATARMWLAKE